jgi:hypothetical protein
MGGAKGDSQNEVGLTAFMKALQELGWTEGNNIRIDTLWAGGNVERMKNFAKAGRFATRSAHCTHNSTNRRASARDQDNTDRVSHCVRSGGVADSSPVCRARAATSQDSSTSSRHGRQMDRVAQGGRAERYAGRTHVQSGHCDLFQILSGAFRGGRAIPRGRADSRSRSDGRRHRTRDRTPHRAAGRRPGRDA